MPRCNGLSPKEELFAQHIVAGKGPMEAHGLSGYSKKSDKKVIAQRAQDVLNRPHVQARIEQLRSKQVKNVLLTVEKRLNLLARNAELPSKSPAARNAQVRAIEVYTRIAGDGASEMRLSPGEGEDYGDRSPLRVVINIFKDSPSRIRNVTPPPAETNGTNGTNGNGNGNH